MGNEFELLSQDAQAWLREFESEYVGALIGVADPWARRLGGYRQSKGKVTWPISLSAAGYKELKGDIQYRSLASKSFDIVPRTWQDGVSELASVVEAPEFFGWNEEPTRIALDGVRIVNRWIAALLAANATCWDGKAFFATDHPANVLKTPKNGTKTFSNTHTGAVITKAYLAQMKTFHATVPDASGGTLGTRLTAIACHVDQEQEWRDILESDIIVQAVTEGGANVAAASVDNRHKGTVALDVCDELTSGTFYGISGNVPGLKAWVVIDDGENETIVNDKSSALYKMTLKIGFASIKRGYAGLAMPHAVHRYVM